MLISSKRVDERVIKTMRELHPQKTYCHVALVRDIADICVTLDRVMRGLPRRDFHKTSEASHFCMFLSEELRADP